MFMEAKAGNSGKQTLADYIADQTNDYRIIPREASGRNGFDRGLEPELGDVNSPQQPFIELALIDEFFAIGKGNRSRLGLLTRNGI
jgi:hypothetical protein